MCQESNLFIFLREPWKRWGRLLIFAVTGIIGCVHLGINFIVLQTPYIHNKDLMQEYILVRAARDGVYPYAPIPELVTQFIGKVSVPVLPHPTPHPPPTILFFYPLGLVTYALSAHIWLWIEIGIVLLIAALLAQWITGRFTPYTVFITAMGLFSWNVVFSELLVGQISLTIALLLIGAWLLLRRKKAIAGGILLGLALALKLFIWPLILFLLVKRAWKATLASLSVFVFANLIAANLIGFHVVWKYYSAIGASIATYYRAFGFNFSLTTLGWRIFNGTGSPVLLDFTAPPLYPSPLLAQTVSFLAPVLLLGLGLWMVIRYSNFDSGYALFAVISLLVSPIAWSHYFVLALIMLAVTLRAIISKQFPKRLSLLFLCLVGLLGLLSNANLALIIHAFSTGMLNDQAQVPFWVGMLSYMPVGVLIALMGTMLVATDQETPLSSQSGTRRT